MITKQLNIKNRTYYFWDDQINIKNFNPVLLKLDKKSSIGANICYIGYVTKKYNINSVNSLYFVIGEIDGFIEEKNGSKYLKIALTDSNKEVLKKYKYGNDYMKIKFDSDDNLSLNVVLKFRILTIVIRYIFEKDGKYYRIEYDRIYISEGIDVNKSVVKSKECGICLYWYILTKTLVISHIFVMDAMI